MTREELIEDLSDLRDYHTVTQRTCDFLKLDLLRKDDHYNAGNDSRITDWFDYLSPTEKDFSKYIDFFAFAVVANLSRFGMRVPSKDEMQQMLEISGYTGEEMKEYLKPTLSRKASCISAKRMVPTVCLLARVFAEAMMDKSEWQGYKKGKKKKNYTPVPNPFMQKLQSLVAYMEENRLLFLDKNQDEAEDQKEYTRFVVNHSRFMCRLSCIHKELRLVTDEIERQQRALAKETTQEMKRLIKKQSRLDTPNGNPSKSGSVKPPLMAPLASPSASLPQIPQMPSPEELSAMMQTSQRYSYSSRTSRSRDLDINSLRDMPPEIEALFKRMEEFDDLAGSLHEECWRLSDQLTEENSAERAAFVSDEYAYELAMAVFQAIRNGDEIYKLKVGRIVMEDLIAVSDIPLGSAFSTELEDDDDWDYVFTECNGKLALPVIKEGECLTFPLDEKVESFQYTMSISAMIARYAERPFEAPLYIRKSLIKKFKDCGCSDRKARDYAVIVATLEKLNELEKDDLRFADDYPDSKEKKKEKTETPEEKMDTRVRKEIAAREEAERALRQAQKENQNCRHEISTLQREIERLKKQLAEKEPSSKNTENEAEDTEAGTPGALTKTGGAAGESITFPYQTKLRVVLYGGFEVFHRELLKLLPDVRVIEPTSHIDVNPIRNADIVFLQINKTDHSGYWTVCDACKISGVPYIHLNYASAKRCAKVMVEEIRKIEGKMQK
ncbi:MAG: hypothetical protein LUI13_10745 [Lachnospiraceae bacterium]|nr:hypothetical protein [Lachnospiraceae bacterium]